MSLEPRILTCDFVGCKTKMAEHRFGSGFPDWGHVGGVLKDGNEVYLCPEHKSSVLEFMKQRQ